MDLRFFYKWVDDKMERGRGNGRGFGRGCRGHNPPWRPSGFTCHRAYLPRNPNAPFEMCYRGRGPVRPHFIKRGEVTCGPQWPPEPKRFIRRSSNKEERNINVTEPFVNEARPNIQPTESTANKIQTIVIYELSEIRDKTGEEYVVCEKENVVNRIDNDVRIALTMVNIVSVQRLGPRTSISRPLVVTLESKRLRDNILEAVEQKGVENIKPDIFDFEKERLCRAQVADEMDQLADVLKDNSIESSDETDNQMDMTCAICLDRKKNVVFMPCRHLASCDQCWEDIKQTSNVKCPFCRADVTNTVQIYV